MDIKRQKMPYIFPPPFGLFKIWTYTLTKRCDVWVFCKNVWLKLLNRFTRLKTVLWNKNNVFMSLSTTLTYVFDSKVTKKRFACHRCPFLPLRFYFTIYKLSQPSGIMPYTLRLAWTSNGWISVPDALPPSYRYNIPSSTIFELSNNDFIHSLFVALFWQWPPWFELSVVASDRLWKAAHCRTCCLSV